MEPTLQFFGRRCLPPRATRSRPGRDGSPAPSSRRPAPRPCAPSPSGTNTGSYPKPPAAARLLGDPPGERPGAAELLGLAATGTRARRRSARVARRPRRLRAPREGGRRFPRRWRWAPRSGPSGSRAARRARRPRAPSPLRASRRRARRLPARTAPWHRVLVERLAGFLGHGGHSEGLDSPARQEHAQLAQLVRVLGGEPGVSPPTGRRLRRRARRGRLTSRVSAPPEGSVELDAQAAAALCVSRTRLGSSRTGGRSIAASTPPIWRLGTRSISSTRAPRRRRASRLSPSERSGPSPRARGRLR